MRRELERIEIPREHEARERTWAVVGTAFAERQPVERRSYHLRPALTIVVALAAVAAALSPPGRAVIAEIREAVGVEHAQQALFSLPSEGDVLVSSDAGVWSVHADGSRRLLGGYREATWSPFGRFVAAVRNNELAALEPDGDVRWTLPRPGVRSSRWAGTATDTRIAYVDRTGIRVVAGDGTGDRLVVAGARGPLAWHPGPSHVLAYAPPREVRVQDADTGELLWRGARPAGPATGVEWSSDGLRLLVLSPHHLRVYDVRVYGRRGRIVDGEDSSEGWTDVAATFRPDSHEVAVARVHGSQSTAYVLSGRDLFNGTGIFRELEWTPDGRWLLVTWPTADQWVFVRADGRRIRAVSNISEQFRSRTFPTVDGWCCAR